MYFILFKLWAFKVFFKAFGFICFYLKNFCCYGNHTRILIYPKYKINIYVQTRIFFSTYIFLYMKGTLPLDRCTCPASYLSYIWRHEAYIYLPASYLSYIWYDIYRILFIKSFGIHIFLTRLACFGFGTFHLKACMVLEYWCPTHMA